MSFLVSGALSALLTLLPAQVPTTNGGLVQVKGQRFLAEIAKTDQEKARGLMYRTNIAKDRCMFFVYDEDGQHGIWMKNCLISLDVMWVKEDGTVAEVQEHVPPCSPMRGDNCPSYGGNVPARYFVEFAAGTFKRLNLKVGDRIGWDLKFTDGTSMAGGAPVAKGLPDAAKKGKARKKK